MRFLARAAGYPAGACRALALALLASAQPAAGAPVDKGLPANGAAVAVEPVAAGFEGVIDIATDDAYADLSMTSADPRLKGKLAHRAEMTQLAPSRVKRLIVSLSDGKLARGAYTATLVATPQKVGEAKLERDVLLTVPAAVIEASETLVIRRVCYGVISLGACWGFEETSSNQPRLWEPTQRRHITGIKLAQKGAAEAPSEAAGAIMAKGAIADASPGAPPRVALSPNLALEGGFPLGTVKGKFAVFADQLAAPVSLDFEVRSSLTRGILILALAGGLALGWLTRRSLKERIERAQEQQKTYALLRLIDATQASVASQSFAPRIAEARKHALAALNAGAAESVKNQTSEAEKSFLALQEEIRQRRVAADQARAEALSLFQAPWIVPPRAAEAIEGALAELKAPPPSRLSNDFEAEARELERTLSEALGSLIAAVDETELLEASVDRLVSVARSLLDATDFATLARLLRPAAPQPSLPTSPALGRARSALEYLHAATAWIEDTRADLAALIDFRASQWRAQLGRAELIDPGAWHAWLARAGGATRALRDPGSGLDQLAIDAAELEPALRGALRAQLRDDELATSGPLIQQSALAEAVTLVARLRQRMPAAHAAERRALESREATAAEDVGEALSGWVLGPLSLNRARAPAPRPAEFSMAAVAPDTTTLALLAAASARNLAATSGWLTSIFGAIIVCGGYFLFAEKWVGTGIDIATAFFWAYAIDIGSDAAISAARGLKK